MTKSLKRLMDTERMGFLWIFVITIAIILMTASVFLIKFGNLFTGITLLVCASVIIAGCIWVLKS